MSRPLRIQFPGAVYHVTARGNEQQTIFHGDRDRKKFVELLDAVVRRLGWRVFTYCLMDNHYHLLVQTPRADLARGMHRLNGPYAQYLRARTGTRGHIFEGRYHAELVEEDAYLLTAARYVAQNPVRARICDLPEDYLWSGHRAIVGHAPAGFVAVAELLAHFGDDPDASRSRYQRFVDEYWAVIDHSVRQSPTAILGTIEFAQRVLAAVPAPSPEVPRDQYRVRPPLSEVLVDHDPATIAVAHFEHGYTLAAIASQIGCHYATVSRWLSRLDGVGAGSETGHV